jgi:hypothetical protein
MTACRACATLVATLSASFATLLPAQHDHPVPGVADSAAVAFVASARAAALRFSDRRTAIGDGYRLIGPDFPSMGEHWVSTDVLLEGRFDMARPALLTYAQVADRPMITGVVYAVSLGPGERAPTLPAGLHAEWHEHNGVLEEEVFSPIHAAGHGVQHDETDRPADETSVASAPRVRLALLHVWTSIENPAGMFEADNWALPFERLHLTVPPRFSVDAARALSLATGGDRFFASLFSEPEGQGRLDREHAEAALAECRASVERIVAREGESGVLSARALDELDHDWRQLLVRTDSSLTAAAAARFRAVASP